MVTDVNIYSGKRNRIHPQKFALWTSFASIIMMFVALTSAYIVKQASGNWLEFALPNQFIYSTIVILCCSLSLHWSLRGFRKGDSNAHKIGMILGAILGLAFVVLQYFGWTALFAQGVDLKGNVSGSFFYIITGLHALHVIGGLAALGVALFHMLTLPFENKPQRILRYELVVHYWHFVDFLWVYLLLFLVFVK